MPLLLQAYGLWEQLERETGRELMTLTGELMIGRRESRLRWSRRDPDHPPRPGPSLGADIRLQEPVLYWFEPLDGLEPFLPKPLPKG